MESALVFHYYKKIPEIVTLKRRKVYFCSMFGWLCGLGACGKLPRQGGNRRQKQPSPHNQKQRRRKRKKLGL